MSQYQPVVFERNGESLNFPIHGQCDDRFSGVLADFQQNYLAIDGDVEEVGSAACVMIDGEPVVDLWGGFKDRERTREWEEDTLVAIRSNSKGLCGIVANKLADEGVIDLDAPVARYWPEFAAGGKADMPVRYILDHRAGLPVLTDPLWPGAIYDWEAMTTALAAQEPLWVPGEEAGYHTITQGFLIGEIVRRVTGMTIGQYAREHVTGPIGADFYFGLTPDEEARCAEFLDIIEGTVYDPKAPASPFAARLRQQFPPGVQASTSQWRRAEVPSSNGHANARGMARLWSAVLGVGKHTILSMPARNRMMSVQHELHEMVGNRTIRQGMGCIVNSPPWAYFGPNSKAFGSHGFGGSAVMADPDRNLVIAYVMNSPHRSLSTGIRSRRIIDATYEALSSL